MPEYLRGIDPKELRGITISAEPLNKPGRENVYRLEEPLIITRKGRRVSILKCLRGNPHGRSLAVKWEVVLYGGVDRGLRFPGLEEEINLMYHPRNNNISISEALIAGLPPRLWMFPG